jgi:hypothetical protein
VRGGLVWFGSSKEDCKISYRTSQRSGLVTANGAFDWCTVDRPRNSAFVLLNAVDREHQL